MAAQSLENWVEPRWKTGVESVGLQTAGKLNGGKTAGKPLVKPPENRWQNRWKAGVEPLEKPPGDHWQKLLENRRPGKAPFLGHFCQSQ